MARLPAWIRLTLDTDQHFLHVHDLVKDQSLCTVCESAKCPNRHECWNRGTATFMLLGNLCTRACRFCAVQTGRPGAVDADEPKRAAQAARAMQLNYVVLTSVTRDDLPDGGAGIYAETIHELRRVLPNAAVEVLTPDFKGLPELVDIVLDAQPDVFNHNVETVERLQSLIRPAAGYEWSLSVLRHAARSRPDQVVKSGIMLGLGETDDEVIHTLHDMLNAGVDLVTLGQYLQPTRNHLPVHRYVSPEEFERFSDAALEMGFKGAASGPMVRSSYRAEELLWSARALLSKVPSIAHVRGFPSRPERTIPGTS